MKKLLLCVAAAATLLTACSKNDDKQPGDNYFTVDGSSFTTTNGLLQNFGSDLGELWFSSIPLSATANGKIDLVYFEIDTLISGQTYTYMPADSSAFDRKKHFSEAGFVYNGKITTGEIDENEGTVDLEIKSGTLTVNKQGDDYTIDYNLLFKSSKTVKGNYKGKIRVTD